MDQKLSHILVVSDIDNTLLQADKGMPSCNQTMIRLFCELGGRFTVASGRSIESVQRLAAEIPLSAPAILYGGALAYDYASQASIFSHTMDRPSARRAVREVLAAFPRLGVEIMSDNGRIYAVNQNLQVCRHASQESLSYVVSRLEDVPGNWYKVLFADDAQALDPVQEFCQNRRYDNIYFLPTHHNYYEIMSIGVDKGAALGQLAQSLSIPMENVYAIGDYHNDADLLRAAGHAIAVGNAVPEIKLLCEQVVLPCMDGGVAQLLYQLIRRYSN